MAVEEIKQEAVENNCEQACGLDAGPVANLCGAMAGLAQTAQIGELALALSRAREKMEALTFDKTNPHFNSRYVSLAKVLEVCLGPLKEEGVSLIQQPTMGADEGTVAVVTILTHTRSGQMMASRLELPAGKANAQGIGSAITYARRYALCAILGLAGEEDDDGNAASETAAKARAANGREARAREAAAREAAAKRALLVDNVLACMESAGIKEKEDMRREMARFVNREIRSIADVSNEELAEFVNAQENVTF